MTERLVQVPEAAERLARVLAKGWATAVCREVRGAAPEPTEVRLRPGVTAGTAAARFGRDVWLDWAESWRDVAGAGLPGVEVVTSRISVERVGDDLPSALRVTGLDALVALVDHLGGTLPAVDLGRVRLVAHRLHAAGARVTPTTLKRAQALPDADVEALERAVVWLGDHPDISRWTARQLPVPAMHTKWLERHGTLLREATGRDVAGEVRPRPAVVHLTYVDPGYLATGGRRHDAWTTGDVHDLAYPPSTVLVVENRDSRLWFPPLAGTLVVEGGGRAAASLLAEVPWVRDARNIVYWGDIDADGFAILDHLRRALAEPGGDGTRGRSLGSILMDGPAVHRYAYLGVGTDKDGRPIPPSRTRLTALDAQETAAYHAVATAGPAQFRRIEQERIPGADARAALVALLTGGEGQGTADRR